jgi:hypothetical protein
MGSNNAQGTWPDTCPVLQLYGRWLPRSFFWGTTEQIVILSNTCNNPRIKSVEE